ncbi:MAG: hypothetical protein OHK0029_39720 [Armatimonadaceae bacterium]
MPYRARPIRVEVSSANLCEEALIKRLARVLEILVRIQRRLDAEATAVIAEFSDPQTK